MLYAERHPVFVAVAAVFGPSSRAVAIVTRKMDVIRLHMHMYLSQECTESVNNKGQYLIFSE